MWGEASDRTQQRDIGRQRFGPSRRRPPLLWVESGQRTVSAAATSPLSAAFPTTVDVILTQAIAAIPKHVSSLCSLTPLAYPGLGGFNQWSLHKTGTMGTLASRFRVQAPGHFLRGPGEYHPQKNLIAKSCNLVHFGILIHFNIGNDVPTCPSKCSLGSPPLNLRNFFVCVFAAKKYCPNSAFIFLCGKTLKNVH